MALPKRIRNWLEGLRFPVLLLITAALFVANLLIPDAFPLVDEALLALVTLLLARLKRRPGKASVPQAGETEPGDAPRNDADQRNGP